MWRSYRDQKVNLVARNSIIGSDILQYNFATTLVVFLFTKIIANSANCWRSWRPDKRIEWTRTLRTHTYIKSCPDYNWNPQTYGTWIAFMRKMLPIWRCDDHIVTSQNNSQLWSANPHARRPESPNHMRDNADSLSLPQEFTRVARKNCQSWRLVQPLQCRPKFNNDTAKFLESTSNKSWDTKHCDDQFVTVLIKSLLDGIHRRALTSEFSRFIRKKALNVHVQNTHESLGHVRDHRDARPTHSNAVPQKWRVLDRVVTRMENYEHPKQKSFDKTCEDFRR